MDIDKLKKLIKSDVFDYQILMSYLGDFKKPRDKISSLIAEGKIIRIKRGLYILGEAKRNNLINLEMIANLIYGPSCISFEHALSLHGLLMERPYIITSLTIGDSKVVQTPIGLFEYRAIAKEKFKVGIEYKNLGEEGGYFIASPEKALIDFVYKTPVIRTLAELRYYLFEEMRMNEEAFRNLDFKKISKIAKIYKKNSLNLIGQL